MTSSNGITINRRTLDTSALNPLEQEFDRFIDARLIGQAKGKRAARRAYRRTLSKLRQGFQPFYVILSLGPTTCGKSEMAYRLGEFFHGSREAVLKLDGSEYIHESQLTKLVGASSQWVGYVDKTDPRYVAPKPTEKDPYAELSNHNLVWSRRGSKTPVTIVLIDEWEKACIEFNQILLSIMRDGKYTLGNGEVVDFSNCIFVLTANIGSAAVEEEAEKNPLGFTREKEEMTQERAESIITKHLKEFAPPEFRARVEENGEIVFFEKLNDDQIAQICDLKVKEMVAVVERQAKITVTVDGAAKKWLLKKAGTVAKVNGLVKSAITDALDNELIKGEIKGGDFVEVTCPCEKGEHLQFTAGANLILTDGKDPESLALMAEFDQQVAAAHGSRRLHADEVNEEAIRKAASSTSKDGATTGGEGEPVRFVQPFVITLVSPDDEKLAVNLKQLAMLMANLKIHRVATHTDHGVQLPTPAGIVEANVSKVEVMAEIASMVALKQAAPVLNIRTVTTEL